jgi:hypothetical protein
VLLAIFTLFIVACKDNKVPVDGNKVNTATVTSIELAEDFYSIFFIGDVFPSNIKANVEYSDGNSEIIDVTNDMTSGFDTTSVGIKTITITFQEKQTEIEITVYKAIKDISLNTEEIEVEYEIGDQFNLEKANLIVSHADDTFTIIPVELWMVENFSTQDTGNLKFKITFRSKTFEVDYTVTAVLESITLVNIYPVFFIGDEFPSDLKLNLIYLNAPSVSIDVTENMASGFDTTTPGKKKVEIAYRKAQTEIEITVYKAIKSFILGDDVVVEYEVGDDIDLANTYLNITHTDDTITYIPVETWMVVDFTTLISGELEYSINFRNRSFEIDYIVSGKFVMNEFEIEFDFNTKKYAVNKYVGNAEVVIIPESINGCQIGYIAPNIFDLSAILKITNLTVPFIGATTDDYNSSFDYFFNFDDLSSYLLKNDMFELYGKITLNISPGYITKIDSGDFLSDYVIGTLNLPEGITEIDQNAFEGSAIKSIVFPNSLKKIGRYAFSNTYALSYIELPESIEEIGNDAFYNDCLVIKVPDVPIQTIGSDVFDSKAMIIIPSASYSTYATNDHWKVYADYFYDSSDINITDDGFIILSKDDKKILLRCSSDINNVIVPTGITEIGDYAFYYSMNITSIVLPEGLKKIGEYAFAFAGNVESITIPDTVIQISTSAFESLLGLRRLYIPSSVTQLGASFYILGIITFESNVPPTITNPESLNNGSVVIFVPDNYVETYKLAWPAISSLIYSVSLDSSDFLIIDDVLIRYLGNSEDVVIPDGVISIGAYAFASDFYSNSKLITVTIPASVKSIKELVFLGNKKLESVIFAENSQLESIGAYAFVYCYNLTTFDWLDSIKIIETNAFNTSGITEVNFSIDSAIERIDGDAFSYCSDLTLVVLPDSLKVGGADLFYSCSNLTVIYMRSAEVNDITLDSDWNRKGYQIYHTVEWEYDSD